VTPEQARHAIEESLVQVAPDADLGSLGPDADLRDILELDSLDFERYFGAQRPPHTAPA